MNSFHLQLRDAVTNAIFAPTVLEQERILREQIKKLMESNELLLLPDNKPEDRKEEGAKQ